MYRRLPQRDRLAAAEAAAAEARRLEHEAKDAAEAFRDAEAEARRADAAPLRAELDALDRPLAEIEQEIAEHLRNAVGVARGFYQRYVATLAKRNAIAGQLSTLGDHARPVQVLAFEAFVLTRLRRFDAEGRSASGAAWAREDAQ